MRTCMAPKRLLRNTLEYVGVYMVWYYWALSIERIQLATMLFNKKKLHSALKNMFNSSTDELFLIDQVHSKEQGKLFTHYESNKLIPFHSFTPITVYLLIFTLFLCDSHQVGSGKDVADFGYDLSVARHACHTIVTVGLNGEGA